MSSNHRLKPFWLTVWVFALLIIVLLVLTSFENIIRVSSEGLTIIGILFVSYLIFSGKVLEIAGGGVSVRFRQLSEKNISFKETSDVKIKDTLKQSNVVSKTSLDELRDSIFRKLLPDRITTLSLSRGLDYSGVILYDGLNYLTSSPYFNEVIFVDELGGFQGWVDPRALMNLLNHFYLRNLIEKWLNDWRLDLIPGVITSSILDNSTIRDALRKMTSDQVTILPVLDSQRRFKGVVRREDIIDGSLSQLIVQ